MNKGKIVQVSGPVIEVEFKEGEVPRLRDALYVNVENEKRVMEVSQILHNRTVRCIMLSQSEGIARGDDAIYEGGGIKVPVGEATLGRMFNVLGDAIDGGEQIDESAE